MFYEQLWTISKKVTFLDTDVDSAMSANLTFILTLLTNTTTMK